MSPTFLAVAAIIVFFAIKSKSSIPSTPPPDDVTPSPVIGTIAPPIGTGPALYMPPPRTKPVTTSSNNSATSTPPSSTPVSGGFGTPIGGGARIGGGRSNLALQSGGGGPENYGARARQKDVVILPFTQPSWHYESDYEYFGAALPSQVPLTAGGSRGQKADAFRWLGDNFGGRG